MSVTSIASTVTSVQLMPAAQSRAFASIENSDTNTLYLLFGSGTASSAHYSVSLASGDYFEIPHFIVAGEVNGVWAAAGTGAALVTTI